MHEVAPSSSMDVRVRANFEKALTCLVPNKDLHFLSHLTQLCRMPDCRLTRMQPYSIQHATVSHGSLWSKLLVATNVNSSLMPYASNEWHANARRRASRHRLANPQIPDVKVGNRRLDRYSPSHAKDGSVFPPHRCPHGAIQLRARAADLSAMVRAASPRR